MQLLFSIDLCFIFYSCVPRDMFLISFPLAILFLHYQLAILFVHYPLAVSVHSIQYYSFNFHHFLVSFSSRFQDTSHTNINILRAVLFFLHLLEFKSNVKRCRSNFCHFYCQKMKCHDSWLIDKWLMPDILF